MSGRRLRGLWVLFVGCVVAIGPVAGPLAPAGTSATASQEGVPHPVPDAADGFQVHVLSTLPAPTAIAFAPGEEPDRMFAASLEGTVYRLGLAWTPAGPVPTSLEVLHEGLSNPFGLAYVNGTLFASAVHEGQVEGREDAVVWEIDGEQRRAVVDGLPAGRHQTNHLREGPSGSLHVGLGPADTPPNQTITNVDPYSGSLLAFDPAEVTTEPAVLHWFDEDGERIPEEEMASHPRNEDFNEKLDVVAHGLETAFGLGFHHDGSLYIPMMGGDDPTSQDVLYRIEPGSDYGFPECINVGPSGGTGDDVRVEPSPAFPEADCSRVPAGTALLGWHVGSTGLGVPSQGSFAFPEPFFSDAVYVSEVGPLATQALVPGVLETGFTANETGHKVTRVVVDDEGEALRLDDFLTGLALPIDVRFGPQGSMYVPDAGADVVWRIAPTPVETAGTSPPASSQRCLEGGAAGSSPSSPTSPSAQRFDVC